MCKIRWIIITSCSAGLDYHLTDFKITMTKYDCRSSKLFSAFDFHFLELKENWFQYTRPRCRIKSLILLKHIIHLSNDSTVPLTLATVVKKRAFICYLLEPRRSFQYHGCMICIATANLNLLALSSPALKLWMNSIIILSLNDMISEPYFLCWLQWFPIWHSCLVHQSSKVVLLWCMWKIEY